jgi:hypothetical protein
VDWINLAKDRDKWQAPVNSQEHTSSIKHKKFLDYLRNYCFFKDSAPCSMLVNWVYMGTFK